MREDFSKNGIETDYLFKEDPNSLTRRIPIPPNFKAPKTKNKETKSCAFCRKNGESDMVVKSHNLKLRNGKIACPILRNYVCPLCHTTGDYAHTLTYCPKYVPTIANPKVFEFLVENSL